jgi:ABC-type transport system involved in multi-copper enzyme maturation permease subunit
MSAVVEHSPDAPAPEAAGLRRGSLLRAEMLRFRSRRFIQVLVAVAVLGWLAVLVIGLLNFGDPTEADYAAAEATIQQLVDEQNSFREQCLTETGLDPDDPSAEMTCGPVGAVSDFRVEDFLTVGPFSFVDDAQSGALAFAAASAVLAFLIGATWIGADWSSRSIVALLFWETRRNRVLAAKVTVLAGAAALLAVVAQVSWLAMAGIWSAAAGDGQTVPQGFWADLAATAGRATLAVVLVAVLGFGLTSLVRNTGAALGIGFVYFAIVESVIGGLRPHWQPWLLRSNIGGLVEDGGLTIYIWDQAAFATGEPTVYLVGNLQAGLYLGAVTAVILAAGAWLFARRDLH